MLRYGLDEPDPSLLILGKKGDPEEALEYCQKLIQQDRLADANVLLDCLLVRNLNPRQRIKSLILKASLTKTHFPDERERKQKTLEQALYIAITELPEGAPEVLQLQELLEPKVRKNPDTWLFEDMLAERAKKKLSEFPCVGLLSAYFKAFEEDKLKKSAAPESFQTFLTVLAYCGSIPYDGFEEYFRFADAAEIELLRTALLNINANTELQTLDRAAVLVKEININPYAKDAHDELDELQKQFKRSHLEDLLEIYINENESELRAGITL